MTAAEKVDTRVTVETPEGVDFQFVIAGPGKRAAAFLLDVIVKLAVVLLIGLLISFAFAFEGSVAGLGIGMLLVTMFVMSWLYGACLETFWNGQTIGKRAQKLRVVRTNGTPIGWYEAFGRNLLLVADSQLLLGFLPLCTVGLLSMAGTRKMQRLGDLVFDTMVIDESREFISRAPGITDGVEALSRRECSQRFQVAERTLAVIERLFEGDRLISDGRREEIARPLSLALREWLGFEEPAPDPRNPNTFFAQSPLKHTHFLKRVLKTFGEISDGEVVATKPTSADAFIDAEPTGDRWTTEARVLRQSEDSFSPTRPDTETAASGTAVAAEIATNSATYKDAYREPHDSNAPQVLSETQTPVGGVPSLETPSATRDDPERLHDGSERRPS